MMNLSGIEKKQIKEQGILWGLVVLVATLMGVVSHLLLLALHTATDFRENHNYLLLMLPLIGVLTAFVYQNFGQGSQKGNNLIIESTQKEIHVPFRMGIFTFIFTILTHLFGGSAGREGSAVQIGGVLANQAGKRVGLPFDMRKKLIHAGVSAGFASIFGTPLAGAFFGMEIVYIGKMERSSLIYCFFAAYFSNFIAKSLGTTHDLHQIVDMPTVSVKVIVVVCLAAVLFGIFGFLFSFVVSALKQFYQAKISNYLVRGFVSAAIFVALILLFAGQKYEGLSLNIMDEAFLGKSTFLDPVLKLLYTGLTLGAGFQGGEVTPLFDIGSSLGSSIGTWLGISPSFLAALGLISVFGCAANAPITTIMLGIDLFGVQALPYYAIASFISYSVTGHHGIYGSQTVSVPKHVFLQDHVGYRLSEIKEKKN